MARRKKRAQTATILIVLLLIVAIIAGLCYYWFVFLGKTWADFEREILHIERIEPNNPDNPDNPDNPKDLETPNNPDPPVVTEGELSIRFLELGNKYTGDCTLIKVGDVEVLIDAGSKRDSAKELGPDHSGILYGRNIRVRDCDARTRGPYRRIRGKCYLFGYLR